MNTRLIKNTLASAYCTAILISLSSMATAGPVQLLVPAYFDPNATGGDWNRLTAEALRGTPITAIMNPNSGPGTAPDADYVRAIDKFRNAGGRVLGYVPSGYAGSQVSADSSCQPASGATYSVSDVISCASGYKNWYRVDGIFIDEVTNTSSTTNLNFYQNLYVGLKALNSSWEIVGNPGSRTQVEYLNNGANRSADTLVVFENDVGYPGYVPSPWNATVPSRAIGHLGYDVVTESTALAFLNLAVLRNAGYVYFTDDGANNTNPWDRLPTYWESEAAAVRRINSAAVPLPSAAFLVVLGLFLVRKRVSN
jgi:hypothetical protein